MKARMMQGGFEAHKKITHAEGKHNKKEARVFVRRELPKAILFYFGIFDWRT